MASSDTRLNCCASASSRNRLCERLQEFTAKVIAHALLEFLSRKPPRRLDNGSFAMDPLWLNPVQPRAFGGKPAWDDTHACFPRLRLVEHCLIVLTQPGSDLLTYMPGGVIPNQHENAFALRLDLLTSLGKSFLNQAYVFSISSTSTFSTGCFVCCDKERYNSYLRRFPPFLSFPHSSQIMLNCIFPLPYVFSISPGSGS